MATSNDPIQIYYSVTGRYPGNNKQWWIARAEEDDPGPPAVKAGDFLPNILDKFFAGNMRAPRGHYILNAFNKDRSFVSGIAGFPVETQNTRPNSVAFFAGRVWYGKDNTVYFSQLLTDKYRAGVCHQEADPTSETISDPIATDGGVIPIPEASKIIRLVPNAGGVLVFTTNGVWYVSGGDTGFTAVDISVNKVSSVGCKSPLSIVETDKGVFWWSDVGIMGVMQNVGQYGPVQGAFNNINLSESTIQSFYNKISDTYKAQVKAIYDPKANIVYWLYRDSDVGNNTYNKVLALDLTLQAFYPWKFSFAPSGPRIKGYFISDRNNAYTIPTDIEPSQIEYITIAEDDLRICQVRNGSFVDWQRFNGIGYSYNSYVETGYELFNDAMRKKNITYLFTYLQRTESGFDDSGFAINPSSCYMTIKFDWASSSMSNKWTDPVQVYRETRFLPMSGSGTYDTGFPMVITKNKVRGNGKSIQFRFGTDEPGRNFNLFGWSIAATGNTVP